MTLTRRSADTKSRSSSAAGDAVAKWLANGGGRGRPRSLPPWEENQWFEVPTCRFVTVNVPNTTLIASANPRRVGIIIAGSTTNLIYVAPNPSLDFTNGGGFPVVDTKAPLQFAHKDYGPLVAMDWYATAGALPAIVTVVEVVLRDWPKTAR